MDESRWLKISGDGRIGKIIGRNIDSLNRCDCRAGHRSDALFEFGDFTGQRRLIADARGQTSEQSRDLAAGLHHAIDIIDQQENVFVLFVTKMLSDRQRRESRAPARARRFIHLAKHQRRARHHARLSQFEKEFMAFARAFADT